MYDIGKELRYQRKINNLTQREVAKALGMGANAISRWEVGDNTLSIYDLIVLADFYDISLDELVGRDYFGRLLACCRLYGFWQKNLKIYFENCSNIPLLLI